MSRAAILLVFENEIEPGTDEDRGDVRFIARTRKTLWIPETSEQTLLQFGIVIERVQIVREVHERRRAARIRNARDLPRAAHVLALVTAERLVPQRNRVTLWLALPQFGGAPRWSERRHRIAHQEVVKGLEALGMKEPILYGDETLALQVGRDDWFSETLLALTLNARCLQSPLTICRVNLCGGRDVRLPSQMALLELLATAAGTGIIAAGSRRAFSCRHTCSFSC